jgi:hypothetical protein
MATLPLASGSMTLTPASRALRVMSAVPLRPGNATTRSGSAFLSISELRIGPAANSNFFPIGLDRDDRLKVVARPLSRQPVGPTHSSLDDDQVAVVRPELVEHIAHRLAVCVAAPAAH